MNITDVITSLMEHQAALRMPQAWGVLRGALLEPFNVLDLQKLNRALVPHLAAWREFSQGRLLRIAILGGYTTQPIKELLLPLVLCEGYWAEVYEGNYNSFETEPFDMRSPLHQFQPDIVLFATGAVNLSVLPEAGADAQRVEALLEELLEAHRRRWQAITTNGKTRIIQHNFDLPVRLPLGRLEGRYAWSGTNFIQRLNERLWAHDGREIRVLDIHQISTECGRQHWFEPRWYHHSKHGFDPKFIYQYGRALGGLLRAMLGQTRKCLVVDLDNTLWGGVIGDDGLDGIELGSVSATGEAYAAFGHYIKALGKLGVVLAVNSKNDLKIAQEVFASHPDMPLCLDDFAEFICNWNHKSENLRVIANRLNLTLDSLVFIEDDEAECAEVRAALPEVTMIKMSGDPSSFQRRIEELHLFTPLDITTEDFSRTDSYFAHQELVKASESSTTLEAHLTDLHMEALVATPQSSDLSRVEQLFRKTNQFNLTGRAYDHAMLEHMLASHDALILAAWLRDKFTNHGLISALAGRFDGDTLVLDNWVISCRVFTRTLEEFIFGWLLGMVRARNCRRIRGEFIATAKNGYAQPLFEKLGFVRNNTSANIWYEIDTATASPPKSFIKLVSTRGQFAPLPGLPS